VYILAQSEHSLGLEITKLLEERKVEWVALPENITASNATGRCFLSMMGASHQMELELRAERAATERASAKTTGKSGRRPRADATIIPIIWVNNELFR
jgi:DNA invertase Pin-like site-specific DNA recombinase